MALFITAHLNVQVKAACNPTKCKKTTQAATSGNALMDFMVVVVNGIFINKEASAKKPNCSPSACKKVKRGEARIRIYYH